MHLIPSLTRTYRVIAISVCWGSKTKFKSTEKNRLREAREGSLTTLKNRITTQAFAEESNAGLFIHQNTGRWIQQFLHRNKCEQISGNDQTFSQTPIAQTPIAQTVE